MSNNFAQRHVSFAVEIFGAIQNVRNQKRNAERIMWERIVGRRADCVNETMPTDDVKFASKKFEMLVF